MRGIRSMFRRLIKNPDDQQLKQEILGVLDCSSAQIDCSYYYKLYKKIVG